MSGFWKSKRQNNKGARASHVPIMMDQSIAIGSKDKNTQTVFLTVEFLFKCPFLSLSGSSYKDQCTHILQTHRERPCLFFFFFFPFYLIDSVRAFLSFWRERIEREREAFKEGGGKRRTTSGSCPSLPTKNKERIDWQFRSRLDTGINTFWRYTTREFLSIQIVSFFSLSRKGLSSFPTCRFTERGVSWLQSGAPSVTRAQRAVAHRRKLNTYNTQPVSLAISLSTVQHQRGERERWTTEIDWRLI